MSVTTNGSSGSSGSNGATPSEGEAAPPAAQDAPETASAAEGAAGETAGAETVAGETAGEKTRLVWDETDMRLSYANIVNVTAAPGEINVFLGTNRTAVPGGREVRVKLSDRVVMTPVTAKRLMVLLAATLKDYEARQAAPPAGARTAAATAGAETPGAGAGAGSETAKT